MAIVAVPPLIVIGVSLSVFASLAVEALFYDPVVFGEYNFGLESLSLFKVHQRV